MRAPAAYLLAIATVAGVAALTVALLPWLGLASAALLFLLPVLIVAAQGWRGPALLAALGGAAAYNFFLLPPRFTFRIHAPDNLVSVLVLIAVAIVTSRLATQLHAREAEARARALASQQEAELAALLAAAAPDAAMDEALLWLEQRLGPVAYVGREGLAEDAAGFSALDRSAAAWALHNGDTTGHGSAIMTAADWTFVPVSPRGHQESPLLAVARPADGSVRSAGDCAQLHELAVMIGQAADRAALHDERRARERLEQADRLRQSLLAALAHDFRTPLTVIIGQLEGLVAGGAARGTEGGAEGSEALAAAHRLDRTMDDLIGAARLEQGALVPQTEAIDLIDVVNAALDGLHLSEDIAVERAVPADVPFVAADPVLLGHIIANLVDNAVRHARTSVTLSAAMIGECVSLSVSDDGPGIAEAERERVFDRFARIEGGDRTHGSGLGLAIVRGFADAMAMTVTVTSSPAGGACFTLSMPLATPADEGL